MMSLAVSNIAWPDSEELVVADAMAQLGVGAVEIAPTKVFVDPLAVSDAEVERYSDLWRDRAIQPVAFQSMLFGRPDLILFSDAETRRATFQRLVGFLDLASRMKVGVLVFGSPKNRWRPPEMTEEEAWRIAVDFFGELGDAAVARETVLCIEPNPPAYGCNFVTTAAQGVALVSEVSSPGFGLHLDTAGMTLAGDDVGVAINAAATVLRHFHLSAPQLGELEDSVVPHAQAAVALAEIGYRHHLSIEMRPGASGEGVSRVRQAVALARRYYRGFC